VKAPISCRPQKKKRQGQENAGEDFAGRRDPAVRQPPLLAQTPYPSRTITMVVAFNAGGSTDLIARVLAQHLGSILGQNLIVENKGGADGAIGSAAVTRAAPDGYTLILSTTSKHVINPLLNKNITYNPLTDFQPI
jgi:tripartite-type tricarboxylate transporter receptor subunit TctC